MILIKIPGLGDPSVALVGYDDGTWFVADSFSFGVERELKRSKGKGGTADINIGAGELQPFLITKRLDPASVTLAQLAVNGNSPGTMEVNFVTIGEAGPRCLLKYKLDRCFVKSWATVGTADDQPSEEVAFHYNKIAFSSAIMADDGSNLIRGGTMSWNVVKQKRWNNTGINFDPTTGFQ